MKKDPETYSELIQALLDSVSGDEAHDLIVNYKEQLEELVLKLCKERVIEMAALYKDKTFKIVTVRVPEDIYPDDIETTGEEILFQNIKLNKDLVRAYLWDASPDYT